MVMKFAVGLKLGREAQRQVSQPRSKRTLMHLLALGTLGIAPPLLVPAHAQAPEWNPASFNPQRDAWQRDETRLSPQTAGKLQLLWKVKVPIKTMGMQSFREPLIVAGVKTASGTAN